MTDLAGTAMGRATMAVPGEGLFCASIEVSVRFLRAVPTDRPPRRPCGRRRRGEVGGGRVGFVHRAGWLRGAGPSAVEGEAHHGEDLGRSPGVVDEIQAEESVDVAGGAGASPDVVGQHFGRRFLLEDSCSGRAGNSPPCHRGGRIRQEIAVPVAPGGEGGDDHRVAVQFGDHLEDCVAQTPRDPPGVSEPEEAPSQEPAESDPVGDQWQPVQQARETPRRSSHASTEACGGYRPRSG